MVDREPVVPGCHPSRGGHLPAAGMALGWGSSSSARSKCGADDRYQCQGRTGSRGTRRGGGWWRDQVHGFPGKPIGSTTREREAESHGLAPGPGAAPVDLLFSLVRERLSRRAPMNDGISAVPGRPVPGLWQITTVSEPEARSAGRPGSSFMWWGPTHKHPPENASGTVQLSANTPPCGRRLPDRRPCAVMS